MGGVSRDGNKKVNTGREPEDKARGYKNRRSWKAGWRGAFCFHHQEINKVTDKQQVWRSRGEVEELHGCTNGQATATGQCCLPIARRLMYLILKYQTKVLTHEQSGRMTLFFFCCFLMAWENGGQANAKLRFLRHVEYPQSNTTRQG